MIGIGFAVVFTAIGIVIIFVTACIYKDLLHPSGSAPMLACHGWAFANRKVATPILREVLQHAKNDVWAPNGGLFYLKARFVVLNGKK